MSLLLSRLSPHLAFVGFSFSNVPRGPISLITTMGLSISGAMMKLILSSWGPIFTLIGSVMNVAGAPLASDPSTWENATGIFSPLRCISSFSIMPGLMASGAPREQ